MKVLFLIPARGGSKGLPRKNIRPLCGKPLIEYSIDVARSLAPDKDICVSTDDPEIMEIVAKQFALPIPFRRPAELATDGAGANEVMLHTLRYYASIGRNYDCLVLLQPTSPLRTAVEVREAMALYTSNCDMVVGVRKSHAAAVMCRENAEGFLEMCFNRSSENRQRVADFYEVNGAVYVINTESLATKGMAGFTKKVKYVMSASLSVDIDDLSNWNLAELLLRDRETLRLSASGPSADH